VSGRRSVLLFLLTLGAASAIGLATIVQPFLGLGLVVALLLVLGVAIRPDVASFAVFFILYTNAAAVAVKFHGVPPMVGALFLTLLLLPFAYYLVVKKQPLIVTPVMPLLLLYLLVQIVSVIFSPENIELSMPNLVTFMTEGVLLYFLVTNVVRTPEILRRAIWVLLVAGLFMGSLSLYQDLTQTLDYNYGGFAQNEEQVTIDATVTIDETPPLVRQAGPVGEKNRYSQIMLMLVPLGMFRFWGERSKSLKVLAALSTVFCIIGSLLTFSRGGAVGLAFTLFIMAAMGYIKPRQITIMVSALALVLIMFPQNLERLSTLQALTAVFNPDTTAGIMQADGAVQGRATEMLAAALVFVDHPVVGVGPGMFPHYVEEYARGLGIRLLTTNREAHNLFLGLAAEGGALGLLCFIGILLISLRDLFRGHRRLRLTHPDLANMNASFMFVIVVYVATGMFLHMAYMRYFWMMLALANVASYLASHVAASEKGADPAVGGSAVPAQRPVAG
jgi:hypothetical protein